jgi:23S rRNA (guanosine2251-2'-O)-methyltransferase
MRLYGLHAVRAALANPRRVCRRLWITQEAGERLGPVPDRPGMTTTIDDRGALDRLVPPEARHQGVVLECEPLPEIGLEDVLAGVPPDTEDRLLIALDQVTDPHNVGAVLRSAAAFGAEAVIVTERHAPGETAALAKAAVGALDAVPLVRVVNLARALRRLQEEGFVCLGLDGAAADTIAAAPRGGRRALVLGAEGEGLRRLTRDVCDTLVRIPMAEASAARRAAGIDSLNVSNAAAVALYALTRPVEPGETP